MLRSNSNKAIENTWQHICDYLDFAMEDEQISAEEILFRDIENLRGNSIYAKAVCLVSGGFFDVYYDDMRESLKTILEETDSEASRYSDEQVYNCYSHIIAKTIEKKLKKYI